MRKHFVLTFIIISLQLFAVKSILEHDKLKDVIKVVEPKSEIQGTLSDSSTTQKDEKLINKNTIDYSKLQETAYTEIERLNVKDMELRDLLRGIAYQYNFNVFVDNTLNQYVTLNLSEISVIDCILFVCDEYDLNIIQTKNILRISKKNIEEIKQIEEQLNIAYRNDLLSVDIKNAEISRVVRTISELSNHNIIVKPGIKGQMSCFFQEIPFEKGLNILVENNGFSLFKKEDVFYVDYSRIFMDDAKNENQRLRHWVDISDENRISFELVNSDIMYVIQDISQKLDINIITYGTPSGKLTAKCSNLYLDQALNFLLKETEFTFKKENDVYIIGRKNISGLVTSKLIKLQHISSEGIIDLIPEAIKRNTSIKVIKEQNAIMVIGTNDLLFDLESYIEKIDHPTPQILIEALVVDFSMSDIRNLGIMMGTNKTISDSIGWSNYSLLDIGLDEQGHFYTQQNAISLNKNITDFSNWMGVTNIGVLPDNFYLKMQALESEGRANVKSRPQIATLNGHTASISIGTTQYYILKSTTPVSSSENIVTQETERFEQVEANVTLSITPWVSASGEVTVEIHPEFKTPVGAFNSEVPPTINSRVIDSTVRLKDGETIILGGLIEEKKSKTYNKVPILGDIPILGHLFRTSNKNDTKTELMIYITPHIFYGNDDDDLKWDKLKSSYDD